MQTAFASHFASTIIFLTQSFTLWCPKPFNQSIAPLLTETALPNMTKQTGNAYML